MVYYPTDSQNTYNVPKAILRIPHLLIHFILTVSYEVSIYVSQMDSILATHPRRTVGLHFAWELLLHGFF